MVMRLAYGPIESMGSVQATVLDHAGRTPFLAAMAKTVFLASCLLYGMCGEMVVTGATLRQS